LNVLKNEALLKLEQDLKKKKEKESKVVKIFKQQNLKPNRTKHQGFNEPKNNSNKYNEQEKNRSLKPLKPKLDKQFTQ